MPVTRADIADLLLAYAEGVQENLQDDLFPGNYEDIPANEKPSEQGTFPVVEDYEGDADRIRAGQQPLHELTRETLLDEGGPACMADDPQAFLAAVRELLG